MDAVLARRLDRLESRAELGELITRYGRAIDDRDLEGLAALFTEDGVMCSTGRELDATGRDAVRRLYTGVFRDIGPSFHWWHGHVIEFDDAAPDHATGYVVAHSETYRKGRQFIAALRYLDTYRREAGRWLFARRELSFLYFADADEYRAILGQTNRVTVYAAPRPADWPETLADWKKYRE